MAFVANAYHRFWESYGEEVAKYNERVANGTQPDHFFLDWNSQVLPAVSLYVIIIAVLTAYMKNRKTRFELKPLMIVYNLICVCLAGAVCVIIAISYPGKVICNHFDVETEMGKLRSFGMWLYYIQKFFEFADTFFFILRQSWRQVTFLHIYHHASIAIVVRQFMLYDMNGDSIVAAFMNSFIHVLMYSHYALSILGKKSWYRKYLTQMQLVQFTIILVQMVASYIISSDCGVPDYLKLLQIVYQVTMLALFSNFYFKAYNEEGAKKAVQKKDE